MVYFPYLDGMLRTRKDREIKNSTVVVFKRLCFFFFSCFARILSHAGPWLKDSSIHRSLQTRMHYDAFPYAGQTISSSTLGITVQLFIHSVALYQTGN